MKTALLIILLLPFLSGNFFCPLADSSTKSFAEGQFEISGADTLIKMERTRCYGFCPAYELTIREDGTITFIGKEHVAHKGRAEGEMPQENLDTLVQTIRESHFMEIPSSPECESRMTDMPSVFLTIEMEGKRHYVNHYHGCRGFEYEEDLHNLEEKIDSLAGVNRWVMELAD